MCSKWAASSGASIFVLGRAVVRRLPGSCARCLQIIQSLTLATNGARSTAAGCSKPAVPDAAAALLRCTEGLMARAAGHTQHTRPLPGLLPVCSLCLQRDLW